MNTLNLNIVTPNGSVYNRDDVELAVLQTTVGELGVMHGHIPTVAPLKIGFVKVNYNGGSEYIAITDGFAEIRQDQVNIIVQTAEAAGEIDVTRAEASRKRAEAYLDKDVENTDVNRAQRALDRANNRIKVANFK